MSERRKFKKFTRRAGFVVLGIIAIDLAAGMATLAFGAELIGR
jgi:hypothetical protein